MTPCEKAVIALFVAGSCFACADSRVERPDEASMMLYRDCMSGMPQQWDSSDASAGLGSKHVASASAGADSHRDARQHGDCVRQAGWEDK